MQFASGLIRREIFCTASHGYRFRHSALPSLRFNFSSSAAACTMDESGQKEQTHRSRYQKHRKSFVQRKDQIVTQWRSRQKEFSQDIKDLALKENIFTIPNFLCIIRIGLTPYVGYLVLNGEYNWACYIFAFAGFTDLLDGWIARRWVSQRSMAGSFLDPLADKLLVTTLVLTLTAVHLIPVPLTALIVFRDICLIAAAFVIRYRSLPPPITFKRYFDLTYASASLSPTTLSKYNTGVQLALVLATLGAPVFGYVDHSALHALWYITAASTLASSASYMFQKDTFRYLIPSRTKTPPSTGH
ncbi:putative cardiolipin synthase (CMP-forming) [Hypsibius exemplaris]|uniref:cardiolipin synthase (CMP-forming) n=1 Tax=Hypsibius exemplaris TaxID=2072580 RepID=A0A1W0WCF7_HYPEX|nr:putative cardiolipin synthase (CMP-forming) [Hypsibius exemplaris]